MGFLFVMRRRPPRATRTDTRFPDTPLGQSRNRRCVAGRPLQRAAGGAGRAGRRAGRRLLDRHRPVLRLLPGAQGQPPGPHRSPQAIGPPPWQNDRMADEYGHLPRHPARVLLATRWSLQGLKAAWLHESSFRLEVYLFVILGPLGFWLGSPPVERVLLVGSCLLVLAVELLNSAVEAVIERFGAEIGRASCRESVCQYV